MSPQRPVAAISESSLNIITLELLSLRALAWGARQLLLHNADLTIRDSELMDRVGAMIEVVEEKALSLQDHVDAIREVG